MSGRGVCARSFLAAFVAGLILVVALAAPPAGAVQPDEMLPDPALEARAREISKDLRCVVCQNQSIDDSNAGLARDMRILVRERLVAGDSNEDVKRFLVDRYGAFVLLKPPVNAATYALWLTPPAALLFGVAIIVLWYRGRRARLAAAGPDAEGGATPTPLSAEDEVRLRALLNDVDGAGGKA
jgi:cytochrome c-type biogenesis protein CcmH